MTHKWVDYGRHLLSWWLVPLVCALVSWQKGLDMNWDVQNYHYYNAWAHLHERYSLDMAPAGMQSFFNPIFDLLWYGLLQLLPLAATGFVMGFLHGLNFMLVRAIALRIPGLAVWASWLSWALGAAAVLSMGFLSELGTAMHDNIVALCALSALLLCWNAQARPLAAQTPYLLLAGAIAGFACAAKLTSAFYALALAVALFAENCVHERNWRYRLQPAAIYSGAVAVTMLAVGGYWYWFNWNLFGNPVFPLFNDIFHSELAAPENHRDERFLPTTWMDWLFRPVLLGLNHTLATELPYRQYTFAVVYLVALAALAWWLWRRLRAMPLAPIQRGSVMLFVFALVSYLLWLKLFGIYRYLITLELLLPLLLVLLLGSLLGHKRGAITSLVLLALLSVNNVKKEPDWGHAPWSDNYVAVELPAGISNVGSILLMGQPIAWLVPAFNQPIPFLQIDPNFSVYGSRYGRMLLDTIDRSREIRVIFNPADYNFDQIALRVAEGGYTVTPADCDPLTASMGGHRFNFRYCRLSY